MSTAGGAFASGRSRADVDEGSRVSHAKKPPRRRSLISTAARFLPMGAVIPRLRYRKSSIGPQELPAASSRMRSAIPGKWAVHKKCAWQYRFSSVGYSHRRGTSPWAIVACRISVPRRLSFCRPILLHHGLSHSRRLPPGLRRVVVLRKHARRKKDFGYRAFGDGQLGSEAGTGWK